MVVFKLDCVHVCIFTMIRALCTDYGVRRCTNSIPKHKTWLSNYIINKINYFYYVQNLFLQSDIDVIFSVSAIINLNPKSIVNMNTKHSPQSRCFFAVTYESFLLLMYDPLKTPSGCLCLFFITMASQLYVEIDYN